MKNNALKCLCHKWPIILACAALAGGALAGECSRVVVKLNSVWRFQGDAQGEPQAAPYDDSGWAVVSLPHSHEVWNSKLSGLAAHGRECGWYRRELDVPTEWLTRVPARFYRFSTP